MAQRLSLETQPPHPWEDRRFLYASRDENLTWAFCPFLQPLPAPSSYLPLPVHCPTWDHARGLQTEKPGLPISATQPGLGTEHWLPAHDCVWEHIILEELFLQGGRTGYTEALTREAQGILGMAKPSPQSRAFMSFRIAAE